MAVHLITVTGKLLRSDGVTPCVGTITFTLSQELSDATTSKTYAPVASVATLDGTGSFSIVLVASNDPELSPTGGTYTITQTVDNRSLTFTAIVPYTAAAGTVDYSTLTPSSPSLTYGVSLAQLNAAVAAALAASGNIIAVQTYNEGVAQRFFSFTPDGSQDGGVTRGPFAISTAGARFNSTWDNVICIGWNMDSSGALIHTGEAGGGWFFEDKYEFPALTYLMEMYWQLKTDDGSINLRPVFVQFDRVTGNTSTQLTGYGTSLGYVGLNVQDAGGTHQLEKITKGATFYVDGQQQVFDNAAAGGLARKMIRFLNVAGTNYWDALQLLSTGLAIGNTGAIRVGENANTVGFNGTNPVAKGTISGSRGGNAALASLLTYLASRGDITDSTTA